MVMPVFDQHTPESSEFIRIIQTRKIPNAFLFTGKGGTGKETAAFWFAQALNCRTGTDGCPCMTCPSCKKIQARTHPDMILLRLLETKKDISISQIREMEGLISGRPNEAQWRMVLISEAGKMSTPAQNALLKVLEEPPVNTFFILTATETSALVRTILSRCRQIRFRSPGSGEIARYLVNTLHVAPGAARIASATAGSDRQAALRLLNLEEPGTQEPAGSRVDWIKRRAWILEQIIGLICSGNPDPVFLSGQIGQEPEHLSDWMSIMRSFFRDLCVFNPCPEKIVNLDFFDAFKDINQLFGHSRISEFMDDFYETERRLESNASIRLSLDRFFIKISFI